MKSHHKTNAEQAIGIFDSGIGGLTVWKEIRAQLPHEDIIYLADSKNCPYGEKSQEEIIQLSKKNTELLLSKGCKLIVVACNTATAAAIDYLRENYAVPFVGMEPATKPAAQQTQTGKIGILATKGTFDGRLFKETANKFTANLDTFIQPGYGLVEYVEENKQESEEAIALLKSYIDPMVDNHIDQLVLGCTHYPFYIPALRKILPKHVQIINPAPAIANRVSNLLASFNIKNIENTGSDRFYTNGKLETLTQTLTLLNANTDDAEALIF